MKRSLSCLVLLVLTGCSPGPSSGGLHTLIETDKGGIELELLQADPSPRR